EEPARAFEPAALKLRAQFAVVALRRSLRPAAGSELARAALGPVDENPVQPAITRKRVSTEEGAIARVLRRPQSDVRGDAFRLARDRVVLAEVLLCPREAVAQLRLAPKANAVAPSETAEELDEGREVVERRRP